MWFRARIPSSFVALCRPNLAQLQHQRRPFARLMLATLPLPVQIHVLFRAILGIVAEWRDSSHRRQGCESCHVELTRAL